jgi:hypothetical protein
VVHVPLLGQLGVLELAALTAAVPTLHCLGLVRCRDWSCAFCSAAPLMHVFGTETRVHHVSASVPVAEPTGRAPSKESHLWTALHSRRPGTEALPLWAQSANARYC